MSKNGTAAAQSLTQDQQADDGHDEPFPNHGMPLGISQMLLPPSMHRQSYNAYVIDAVRADPLQNPLFTKKSLKENDRVRDAVRAVLQAGSEREKAVLVFLHHKLLSVAAGRFMDQLTAVVRATKNGFGKPLIPGILPAPFVAAEAPVSPAAETSQAAGVPVGNTSAQRREKEAPPWRKVVAVITTPKYFISAAGLALAITTGLWQLQVRNLNNTIDTYKKAAAATTVLEERMNAQVESAEKEQKKHDTEKKTLTMELAAANAKLNETSNSLGKLEGEVTALRKQIQDTKEQASKQGATASEKETALQTSLTEAEKRAGAAIAELKTLKEQKATLDKTVQSQEKSLIESQASVEALRTENTRLLSQASTLTADSIKLTFAQTFIESVRRHVSWYDKVESKPIRGWLEQFDTAMTNVTR